MDTLFHGIIAIRGSGRLAWSVVGRCDTIRRVCFWHHIPQPIIGLSPMDGVTDLAFRFIVARHGKPDVQVTEFVNVDEVCYGGDAAWQQLQYAEIERPIV